MEVPNYITKSTKPAAIHKVMNEAIYFLVKFGIPIKGLTERKLERMAMAFLAVANVKDSKDWASVRGYGEAQEIRSLKTREIIEYMNEHFHENISSGSYDDIRRKDLKLPVLAGIITRSAGNPNAARNDPTRAYALSPKFAALIRSFGRDSWNEEVETFLRDHIALAEELDQKRQLQLIPVILPGEQNLTFSPGKHNELQKAIIELFLPRFGFGAELLYVGDAANKFLFINQAKLKELLFFDLSYGELPDILAYSSVKNWLFLIEAVYSSGPISPLRLIELKKLTAECTAEIIFVTAFLDRDTFRKFMLDIAWETEVWIADTPNHLIHFDGEHFLGPYKHP
jgi:type II restriction enzyme